MGSDPLLGDLIHISGFGPYGIPIEAVECPIFIPQLFKADLRPFDLLVFPAWSIFGRGPKR